MTRRERGDGFNTEIAEVAEIYIRADGRTVRRRRQIRARRQLIVPAGDVREAHRGDVRRKEIVRRVGRGMPRRKYVAPEDRAWIVLGDRAVAGRRSAAFDGPDVAGNDAVGESAAGPSANTTDVPSVKISM